MCQLFSSAFYCSHPNLFLGKYDTFNTKNYVNVEVDFNCFCLVIKNQNVVKDALNTNGSKYPLKPAVVFESCSADHVYVHSQSVLLALLNL